MLNSFRKGRMIEKPLVMGTVRVSRRLEEVVSAARGERFVSLYECGIRLRRLVYLRRVIYASHDWVQQ